MKNQSQKLPIELFLEVYATAVNDHCYSARLQLDRAEWQLSRFTDEALFTAARLRGEGDPVLQFGQHYITGAQTDGDDLPFADACCAMDVEPEDFDTLIRFLRLRLTVARCRAILAYWKPVRFHFEGDDLAFDLKANAMTRADFRGRFKEWLDTDEHWRASWAASGHRLEDVAAD